jgi:hypothetical protein
MRFAMPTSAGRCALNREFGQPGAVLPRQRMLAAEHAEQRQHGAAADVVAKRGGCSGQFQQLFSACSG